MPYHTTTLYYTILYDTFISILFYSILLLIITIQQAINRIFFPPFYPFFMRGTSVLFYILIFLVLYDNPHWVFLPRSSTSRLPVITCSTPVFYTCIPLSPPLHESVSSLYPPHLIPRSPPAFLA